MGQNLCTSARTKKGEISNSTTDLLPKRRRPSSAGGPRTLRQASDGGPVTGRSADKHSWSPAGRRDSSHRRAKSLSRDDSVWAEKHPAFRSVESSSADLGDGPSDDCELFQPWKQDGGFVNIVADPDVERLHAEGISVDGSVRKSTKWNESRQIDGDKRNHPPLFRCESEPNSPQRPPKVPNHNGRPVSSRPDISWIRSSRHGPSSPRRSSTTSPSQRRWNRYHGTTAEHKTSKTEHSHHITDTRTQQAVREGKLSPGNYSNRKIITAEDYIDKEHIQDASSASSDQSKFSDERSRDGTDRLVEMTKQILIDLLSDYNSVIFSELHDAGLSSSHLCFSLARSESRQSTCRILLDYMTELPYHRPNSTDYTATNNTVNSRRPASCTLSQSCASSSGFLSSESFSMNSDPGVIFATPKIGKRPRGTKSSRIETMNDRGTSKLFRQDNVEVSDADDIASSSVLNENRSASQVAFMINPVSEKTSKVKEEAEDRGFMFALVSEVIRSLPLHRGVSKSVIETLDTVDHLLKIASTFRKLSSNKGLIQNQNFIVDSRLVKQMGPRGAFILSPSNSSARVSSYGQPSLVNDVINEESDDVTNTRGVEDLKAPAFRVELILSKDANMSSFSERYDCSALSPAIQRQSRVTTTESKQSIEETGSNRYSIASDLHRHNIELDEQNYPDRTDTGKLEGCLSVNCACGKSNESQGNSKNVAEDLDDVKSENFSQKASYRPFRKRETKKSKADDPFRRWSVNCDYSDLSTDDINKCSNQKLPNFAQRTFSKSCESELLLEDKNMEIYLSPENRTSIAEVDKNISENRTQCIKCGKLMENGLNEELIQSPQSNGEVTDVVVSDKRKNSLQRLNSKTGSLLRNLGATFDFSSSNKSKQSRHAADIFQNSTPRHRRSIFRISRPKSSPCLETDSSSFEKYVASVGTVFKESVQSSNTNFSGRYNLCDFCKISTPYYKNLLQAASGTSCHTPNNLDSKSLQEFKLSKDVTPQHKSINSCNTSQMQSLYTRPFSQNSPQGESCEIVSNDTKDCTNLASSKFSSASSNVLSQFIDVDDTLVDNTQHQLLRKHYSAPIRVDSKYRQLMHSRIQPQRSFEPPIFSVSLSNCRPNDFLLEQLGHALKRYHLIRRVSIMLTESIGLVAMDSICKALERPDNGLIQLDVRLIRLTENTEVMRRLVEGLMKATCLRELNLSSVGLTGACHPILHAITAGCGMRTLCDLDLAFNELSDEGCAALTESLTGSSSLATIRRLQLRNNNITTRGARLLAQVLRKNSRLVFLDVSSNTLGDEGLREIFQSLLSNRTLSDLELDDCGLTSEGCRHVSRALASNTCLRRLSLSMNPLGDEGTTSLAEGLRYNRTLQVLAVNLCGIGNSGFYRLLSECNACHSLCTIKACYNYIGEPHSNLSRSQHRRWSSISTATSNTTGAEPYRRAWSNRLSWTPGGPGGETSSLAPDGEALNNHQDEPNIVEIYSKLCEVLRYNSRLKILLWGNKLEGFLSQPNRIERQNSAAVIGSKQVADTSREATTARKVSEEITSATRVINSETGNVDVKPRTHTARGINAETSTDLHVAASAKRNSGTGGAQGERMKFSKNSSGKVLLRVDDTSTGSIKSVAETVRNSTGKLDSSEKTSMRTKRISTGCMNTNSSVSGAVQRRSVGAKRAFTESHFHYCGERPQQDIVNRPALNTISTPNVESNGHTFDSLTTQDVKNTQQNGHLNSKPAANESDVPNDLVIQCDRTELFTTGSQAGHTASVCLQSSEVSESSFRVPKTETIDSGYGTSYND